MSPLLLPNLSYELVLCGIIPVRYQQYLTLDRKPMTDKMYDTTKTQLGKLMNYILSYLQKYG